MGERALGQLCTVCTTVSPGRQFSGLTKQVCFKHTNQLDSKKQNNYINNKLHFAGTQTSQVTEDYSGVNEGLIFCTLETSQSWWDISTLEMYLKEGILSRSLRWEVAPQDIPNDQESMSEWLTFLAKQVEIYSL